MWLLPFSSLTFSSQAEADEVLASIKESTIPAEMINFLPGGDKKYSSSFLGHRFTLHENSFFFLCPCTLSGDVVSFGFETTVHVNIRPSWFFVLLLLGVFVLVALVAVKVYFGFNMPANNEMPSYGFQALPVGLYLLLLVIFRWKIIKHRRQLMGILKADKVR